jgi:NAD(P)-dependent dehydrogenase (short-subunit alcohol dehydrogenase family)
VPLRDRASGGRRRDVDDVTRDAASAVSIGRLVTADEVAAVVAFLASPKSVALNGDPVVASGGSRGVIHY